LFVANVLSLEAAFAAMKKSLGPIEVPAFSSLARIFPFFSVTTSSKGRDDALHISGIGKFLNWFY
jgi:hypothetical protein